MCNSQNIQMIDAQEFEGKCLKMSFFLNNFVFELSVSINIHFSFAAGRNYENLS